MIRKLKLLFSLFILILLVLIPFTLLIGQQKNIKELKVAVLPFLVKSDDYRFDDNYGKELSKLITTKLYYSTMCDVLTMSLVEDALKTRAMNDLSNIQEQNLYLMATSLKIDYILVPRIIINSGKYRLEGSVYEAKTRTFVKNSLIAGKDPSKYIFNDIDAFTEELFSNILKFTEYQPILKPAQKSNIDVAIYFNLQDSEYEYREFREKSDSFIKSLNLLALGDYVNIAFIYSKNIKNTTKYIIHDFVEDNLLNKEKIPVLNNRDDINFLNSQYDDLIKALGNLSWSKRRHNERVLFAITKDNVADNSDNFASFLNEKNIKFINIKLENTTEEVMLYNQNISELCNGVSIPLSYIMSIPSGYPIRSKYILKDGSLYKFHSNTGKQQVEYSEQYINEQNLDILSYDIFVYNIKSAIDFLYVSGYIKTKKPEYCELKTDIETIFAKSLNMIYNKNFEIFKYIMVFNEGIIKEIPIPLYVADIVISKFKDNKDSILIGARVIPTNSHSYFELDPFSLILPKNTNYIPENIVVKDFLEVSKSSEYYNQNGIMQNNIWFFDLKLVDVKK